MAKYRSIGDDDDLDEILGAQRPLTLSHGTLGDRSRYPQIANISYDFETATYLQYLLLHPLRQKRALNTVW